MNFNAHIVQALSEIGDARAIPLIEELIQTYREVLPKLLSDPEEEIQSNRASIEADFKARIAALQNSREWIVMVNGPDPVTALIPFLYDLNGGWPERAFRALARLDPPTFPAHLRASYDLLKGRSKEFRSGMNTLYEVEVLRALDQRGTPLTPDERRFLSEWDTYEGCVPPTLPD
jgi:hypothetical protein